MDRHQAHVGSASLRSHAPRSAPRRFGRFRAGAILLIASAFTAGCASRPDAVALLPVADQVPGAKEHQLLVATTRRRDARPGTLFSGARAEDLDFARVTMSVPPAHRQGETEAPSSPPADPALHFVAREASYLPSERAFIAALNEQLAARRPGDRKILLFVHGYNTHFAEGVLRLTQIVHDVGSPAVPVLFSWASRGRILDYVYDNNSATVARDALERTIRIAFASRAEQVNIVAHSMGNWATLEALRQIRISGDLPPASKLGAVILAAPDIDLDVFKSQMRRFGVPKKPFFIVLSRDDRALQASSLIAGGQKRLGMNDRADELEAMGAVVLDLSSVSSSDVMNHGKFAALAAIGPSLPAILAKGIGTPAGDGRAGPANFLQLGILLPGVVVSTSRTVLSGSR